MEQWTSSETFIISITIKRNVIIKSEYLNKDYFTIREKLISPYLFKSVFIMFSNLNSKLYQLMRLIPDLSNIFATFLFKSNMTNLTEVAFWVLNIWHSSEK